MAFRRPVRRRARQAAGIGGGRGDGAGRLVLREILHVADGAHAGTLVDRRFHFRREGNVLHQQIHDLQAEGGEVGLNLGRDQAAELVIIAGQVDGGDLRAAQGIGESGGDQIAQLVLDLIDVKRASVPATWRRKAAGSLTRMA
jgi:hypothetical protein